MQEMYFWKQIYRQLKSQLATFELSFAIRYKCLTETSQNPYG